MFSSLDLFQPFVNHQNYNMFYMAFIANLLTVTDFILFLFIHYLKRTAHLAEKSTLCPSKTYIHLYKHKI